MLYSNYNVMTIHRDLIDKYKVGDIYTVPETAIINIRRLRYNGLVIREIRPTIWGINLTFDYEEWFNNPVIIPQTDSQNKMKFL